MKTYVIEHATQGGLIVKADRMQHVGGAVAFYNSEVVDGKLAQVMTAFFPSNVVLGVSESGTVTSVK